MTNEPKSMSDLYASSHVTPNDIVATPYEQAEVRNGFLMCPCMNQITYEHLHLGYHPPCMRTIQIVLTKMVKDS